MNRTEEVEESYKKRKALERREQKIPYPSFKQLPSRVASKPSIRKRTASRVQQALFEYYTNPAHSYKTAAIAHDLNTSTFHRIYLRWRTANPTVTPASPSDMVVPTVVRGRPRAFKKEEEDMLSKTVLKYAENGWPLTAHLVREVAEHFLDRFLTGDRRKAFKHGTPSRGWVEHFIARRPELRKRSMRYLEEKRMAPITPAVIGEHIARVKAVLQRYGINEASRVVNLDEVGVSFDRMSRRSLRRGVVHSSVNTSVDTAGMRTRGILNHVTVLVTVAANGYAFTPVVVFPGKQPHYRRLVSGKIQTVHDFLPPAHVFHRTPAGVDSSIFLAFAEQFIEETAVLRAGGKHMALIYDGFGGHIQYEVLSLLADHDIHVIALPSHSSHVLQPLDVSVFAPFKAAVQAELHKMSRHTRCIDVFGASSCIAAAYNASVNYTNIVRGFEKTGLWVREVGGPSAEPLTTLFLRQGQPITVDAIMRWFDKSTRGLLFGPKVMENGTVRIDTSTGAVLTCDAVIGALLLCEQRREQASAPRGPSAFQRRAKVRRDRRQQEDVDDRLAPQRSILHEQLDSTRATRRAVRKNRASSNNQRSLV